MFYNYIAFFQGMSSSSSKRGVTVTAAAAVVAVVVIVVAVVVVKVVSLNSIHTPCLYDFLAWLINSLIWALFVMFKKSVHFIRRLNREFFFQIRVFQYGS